jgi:hypothetical protein
VRICGGAVIALMGVMDLAWIAVIVASVIGIAFVASRMLKTPSLELTPLSAEWLADHQRERSA